MTFIVVIGPPAAGKSTWVRAHAHPTDIVIDFDRLASALTASGVETHRHSRAVARVAFAARRAAVDVAMALRSVDVYVIHAVPSAGALDHYRRQGARIVTVDPGEAIVMQRIAEMRPTRARLVAQRWYAADGKPEQAPAPAGQASRSW